jgi:hypothetical protein
MAAVMSIFWSYRWPIQTFSMAVEQPDARARGVLAPDEVVPFFINVVCDGQRLYEVVQSPLNATNPEEVAASLVTDLGITPGFRDQIQSLIEVDILDYQALTKKIPSSEWALSGSATHILSFEVGIDSVVYSDLLEWDIFDLTADPDDFARITVKELGLPVEFVNVISGQIRWQVIRLRAMHCEPDRLRRFIEAHPESAPQTHRGLRRRTELLDASPVVGLVPGVTAKKTMASRDRHARYIKRMGHTVSRGALQPAEDPGLTQVKVVPIVRARPMPEDSVGIDLAEVPRMLGDPRYENPEVVQHVQRKFQSPLLLSQRQHSDDSGSDSGAEM